MSILGAGFTFGEISEDCIAVDGLDSGFSDSLKSSGELLLNFFVISGSWKVVDFLGDTLLFL